MRKSSLCMFIYRIYMSFGLRNYLHKIKKEIQVYRSILRDARTPLISKILLWLAVGYLVLPFDLIPDWIPLLGHVDDIVLVPFCIILAMLFIPKEVILDHRKMVEAIV